jgi:hypothetical protein
MYNAWPALVPLPLAPCRDRYARSSVYAQYKNPIGIPLRCVNGYGDGRYPGIGSWSAARCSQRSAGRGFALSAPPAASAGSGIVLFRISFKCDCSRFEGRNANRSAPVHRAARTAGRRASCAGWSHGGGVCLVPTRLSLVDGRQTPFAVIGIGAESLDRIGVRGADAEVRARG